MSGSIESSRFHEVGWRVLAYAEATHFRTGSLAEGAALVEAICEVARTTSRQPDVDLRSKGVTVRLQRDESGELTEADLALAGAISGAARELGATVDLTGLQSYQVAIDALVIPDVLPFWEAVLGYERFGDALIDPDFEGPTFWFQQMDAPRPQRIGSTSTSTPEDQARLASTRSPWVPASSTRLERRCGGPGDRGTGGRRFRRHGLARPPTRTWELRDDGALRRRPLRRTTGS
jgi:4a-hydroxytetrahydrobiopterin dehydratase